MFYKLLTLAALAVLTTARAQEVDDTNNNPTPTTDHLTIVPFTPNASPEAAATPATTPAIDFSCQSCADNFSECGIACLMPNLTWENIYRCQGVCKENLCNGVIGQPCRDTCKYSLCEGWPLAAKSTFATVILPVGTPTP